MPTPDTPACVFRVQDPADETVRSVCAAFRLLSGKPDPADTRAKAREATRARNRRQEAARQEGRRRYLLQLEDLRKRVEEH
eukprot:6433211-Prymnesium_polylepis.1